MEDLSRLDIFMLTTAIASIILAVVSVGLALFATWLSFRFYKWSDDSQNKLHLSTEALQQTTKKIEDLFGKLYSDIWKSFRDSQDDIRKQAFANSSGAYNQEDIDKIIAQRLEQLLDDKDSKLRQIIGEQTDKYTEIQSLIDEAIKEARDISASSWEDTIWFPLAKYLTDIENIPSKISLRGLVSMTGLHPEELQTILRELKEMGAVRLNGFYEDMFIVEFTPEFITLIKNMKDSGILPYETIRKRFGYIKVRYVTQ
jgi:hypothetical protein